MYHWTIDICMPVQAEACYVCRYQVTIMPIPVITAGSNCQDSSAQPQRHPMLTCAGDLTAERVSATGSPALSKSGALKIPRLHLSPAPSATAADFRGMLPLHMSPATASAGKAHALHQSPAPYGGMRVPPLRLSPAPSGGAAGSRAGSAFGLPTAIGGTLNRSDGAQAQKAARQQEGAGAHAPSASWRVPTLKLPGQHKGTCLSPCCPCHSHVTSCLEHAFYADLRACK